MQLQLVIRQHNNGWHWLDIAEYENINTELRNITISPSMEYKLFELAAVKLASRASSVIAGGRKHPLFISIDPGSAESPSEINIGAWLLLYGTPEICGNGRHWGDVSMSTSSVPDVAPPPLALIHPGRRTAPTAATGLPDPAGRPAAIQPHFYFVNIDTSPSNTVAHKRYSLMSSTSACYLLTYMPLPATYSWLTNAITEGVFKNRFSCTQ